MVVCVELQKLGNRDRAHKRYDRSYGAVPAVACVAAAGCETLA